MSLSDQDWPRCACGCGEPVSARMKSDRKRGVLKGDPCKFVAGHSTVKPLALRLIEHSADSGSCRVWEGTLNQDGYGRMKIDGIPRPVHRIAYEQWVGPIPDGFVVHHICRVPSCIAPKHLEAIPKAVHDAKPKVCPHCGRDVIRFQRP